MTKLPFHKTLGNADVCEALDRLNKRERHAVLATDSGGQPYTSLIAFALSDDLKGIIFATARNTSKYKNILKNRNVSLMIDSRTNSVKSYMYAEAVTVLGRAVPLKKGKRRYRLLRTFLKKHPVLAEFVKAPSTSMVFIEINRALHVSQFQTVSQWRVQE